MKRGVLHLLSLLLLAAMLFPAAAYGTEIQVSLNCEEQIRLDTSFSAALEYRGAAFAYADLEVTYDPAVLKFRSCSGGEGFEAQEGLARIHLDGGDGKTYLSCKIRFDALGEGESYITVTSAGMTDQDDTALIAETRSVKVSVLSELTEESGDSEEGQPYDQSESENSAEAVPDGGLLGFWEWIKDGISSGEFLEKAGESYSGFMKGLSITEFLVLSLCGSVILLLAVLLAAERRKGKK